MTIDRCLLVLFWRCTGVLSGIVDTMVEIVAYRDNGLFYVSHTSIDGYPWLIGNKFAEWSGLVAYVGICG